VGYTAIQAARLSGCTSGQLDTWRRIGLIVPRSADGTSAADAPGTPDAPDASSPYSFRDLVALRMVASLLDAGLPMPRIRKAVAELLRHGDDITGLRLVTDGETVWACHDDGQILDALRHGQLALFVAVDRLADDVSSQVHAFDIDRRAFVDELHERRSLPTGEDPAGRGPAGTGRAGHPCQG
jgi:DNA-binding transcriptional MerR regulator